MRTLFPRFCALTAVLLWLALPAFSCYGWEKTPVTIGAFYNTTGDMAAIDGPALKGAKLAVKQANARGGVLGGRKVELKAFDTRTDLKLASSMAATASKMSFTAVIGYGDSDFVLAAAPHFQEKGIPFVTSGATDPTLPQRIGARLFLAAFGDDDQAAAVAEYAYQRLKVRKVLVWTDHSTDFAKTLSRFFKSRFTNLGGTITGEHLFKSGDRDFSSLIARLKSLRPAPDALFAASVPGEAGFIVKQVRESGITIPILSGDGFDTTQVISIPGPKYATRVFFSTHMFRDDKDPRTWNFVDAYTNEYGAGPENAFAALGYDAAGLVIDAIKRADVNDIGAVASALANTYGYEAVTGTISYSPRRGVPSKPVSILGIEKGKFELMEIWKPMYSSPSLLP